MERLLFLHPVFFFSNSPAALSTENLGRFRGSPVFKPLRCLIASLLPLTQTPKLCGSWSFCSCHFLREFISNRPLSVGLMLLNWEWGENHCKLVSARYLRDLTDSGGIFYISFSAWELLDHVSDCKPARRQAQR